jgi:DNA polymerase I-like protein with 3'-5' exonuclease and polymerase domains/uracil-DNA glycosylase
MINDVRLKYSNYQHQFSRQFQDVSNNYQHVKLPYYASSKSDRKILFVLDYVPTDDLQSGKLLKGTTGELLDALEDLSYTAYGRKQKRQNFSWLACTFNAFKTVGKSKEFQAAAREEFTDRVKKVILNYKPDTVITFGDVVFKQLMPELSSLTNNRVAPWHGVPVDYTVKRDKESHSCKLVANIGLNPVVTGDKSQCTLLGYMSRRLLNGFLNTHPYAIDSAAIAAHTSVLIDTIPKFNKMLDMLMEQPVVAVDTETKNLSKVTNRVLTIQFAKCLKYGYFVPIHHKDSPFTNTELKFIKTRLRSFFGGYNKNKYHIYTNAVFDLNVIRKEFNVPYMANSVWDILAGEFAIDENHKFLDSVSGDYYYSLGNLSVQYGYTGYLTSEFSKKDRASIYKTPLTPAFIKYGTLDVVVPFAIHEKQIKLAEDIGHAKYKSLVVEQISDLLHGFSVMNKNGNKLDINYLFSLQAPDSPIEKVIQEKELKLLSSDAAKKANKILARRKGVPQKGLFGASSENYLSLRKIDHKHLLFFEVLKLEPLKTGKSGKGKLDKGFQNHYADVPEVSMYTDLEKAKKLKNAFVKSFIKLLGTDDDIKSDHKIRPSFHYLKVITGRTSESDPNLQQVPSHSELGKHIKRLFIAEEGYLYLKVDYRVHEVRGWGIISFDKGIAQLFLAAKKIRDAYKLHPTSELKKRLKLEADIHIMNASYFFSKAVESVDKELRNSVKNVVFGLIYQMSVKSLARRLDKTLEYTENLVKNFNKRFPSGMKWIEDAKKQARKYLFYENPVGFRRHLWGYILPKSLDSASKIHASLDRQAVNSPIQGMGAQFMAIGNRVIDTMINDIRVKEQRELNIKVCNSVHDSLENQVAYSNFWEGVSVIERGLTEGVSKVMVKRHNFKFNVDLEIDFEVGSNLANCQGWDGSIVELEQIIYESLLFQRDELKYSVDIPKVMEDIFVRQLKEKTSPSWARQQAENVKYKFDVTKYKDKNKKGKKHG